MVWIGPEHLFNSLTGSAHLKSPMVMVLAQV